MNIAIIIDTIADGGAENVMISLAHEFNKLHHRVHFIVINETQKKIDFPLHSMLSSHNQKFSYLKLDQYAKKITSLIDKLECQHGKFDLFLANLEKSHAILAKTKLKSVFHVIHASIKEDLARSARIGPFHYLKKRFTLRYLHNRNLVTVSEGIKNEILHYNLLSPKSINTIYNPFDFTKIQSKANINNPLIPKEKFIIHVGRVVKQKRHDILFQAIKLMKNDYKVVLLCNNIKKAHKLANKYHVTDRIIIPGFQTNPYPWIKHADLLVLSSDFEGLPTVLIESLIIGTPTISTDCPHGPKEILTDNLKNLLVPRRNPQALANKLDEVLINSSININRSSLQKFSADTIAEKYLHLITEHSRG